jgi:amidase
MEAVRRSLESMMNDLPAYPLSSVLTSEYRRRNYYGAIYGKAQNITLEAREAYNKALSGVGALIVPTIPILSPEYGNLRTMDTLLEDPKRGAVIANTTMFDPPPGDEGLMWTR